MLSFPLLISFLAATTIRDVVSPATSAQTSSTQSQSSSSQSSNQASTVVNSWSNLPAAFEECSNTLSKHVSKEEGLQAIRKLRSTCDAASNAYTQCPQCQSLAPDSAPSHQFQQACQKTFVSMNKFLDVGQKTYGSSWKQDFGNELQGFNGFASNTQKTLRAFKLSPPTVLAGLGLSPPLFGGVGINLAGLGIGAPTGPGLGAGLSVAPVIGVNVGGAPGAGAGVSVGPVGVSL